MRFLANENFPHDAVDALRSDHHDVAWVRIDAPGSGDEDVLARARHESRIIVTFDKDFGELAFHSRLPASCGIILFRVTPRSPEFIVRLVTRAIGSRDDWVGNFAVVEEHRVRMRPLPQR